MARTTIYGWWIEERLGRWACDPDLVLWDELDPEALAEILREVGPDMLRHIPPGDVWTAGRDEFVRRIRAALR